MHGQATQVEMTKHKDISIDDWNILNSAVLLAATGITLYFNNIRLLIAVGALSFIGFCITQIKFLSTVKPFGGYANWVTGFRLILILLGMAWYPYLGNLELFAILGFAVTLDVVDGWLARRFDHQSLFGMYFDMETDALYVLLVCVYLCLQGMVGVWIIIPGILRYVYRIFIFFMPKENYKEQKQRYAAFIAGSYFVILLLSVAWQNQIQQTALILGSLAIVGSFGKSFWDYLRYNE